LNVVTLQREVRPALLLILALSTFAWLFVFWTAYNMDAPLVRLMMPASEAWSATEAVSVWTMWAVMMVAMMLPSAAPMILTHRRIVSPRGNPKESVFFELAYLLVWAAFSVVATLSQWGLQSLGVLTHMLTLKVNLVSGIFLVAAGAMQWSPTKRRCLAFCRTPVGFLTTEWKSGNLGALRMGLKHGIYCVGCCWVLMALLFVLGVMNLFAILLLSTFVAAEKLLPHGEILGRSVGLVFGVWGLWLMVT
jgi:predicted metal-binding membrane protein